MAQVALTSIAKRRDLQGSAAPTTTTQTFYRGEVVWNTAPTGSSDLGWVCTADGSPGTWVSFPGAGGGGGASFVGSFVGDGVATQFGPVTHNLGTSTPSVEVIVAGVLISDGWSATITDANNVTIDFGAPPANTAAISVKVSA